MKNSKQKNNDVILNHGPPKTRRDFLSSGLIGISTSVIMPGVLDLINPKKAFGAIDCSAAGTAGMPPFLVFDLAGGANIPLGNVLVGKNGSQENFINDAAAANLGSPSDRNPLNNPQLVDNELGLLFHANSAFLAGLRSATEDTTRANIEGLVLATRTGDDTRSNPSNPVHFIMQGGLKGSLIDFIGNGQGNALGRSVAPDDGLTSASNAIVQNPDQAVSLVAAGLLDTILPGQTERILQAARSMSENKLKAFAEKDLPSQISELINCGYVKSIENLKQFTPDVVNPANDPIVAAVTGLNRVATDQRIPNQFQVANGNDDSVTTIAKMVIDGYAGAGTISLGGYDYHGQSRANTAQRDFDAGRSVGMAIEMAARKQKPLVVSVLTDGGVSSSGGAVDNDPRAAGGFSFRSDSGTRSASFMLVYNPVGKAEVLRSRQIGSYLDDSGAVDQNATVISNSATNMAKAMALNYLALADKLGDFGSVTDSNPFSGKEADYVVFGPLAK